LKGGGRGERRKRVGERRGREGLKGGDGRGGERDGCPLFKFLNTPLDITVMP